MKNFPLLNEIDEQINIDDIDWNKNAFQTLLTSNLPINTIFYYAIEVGLRRLDNSLYEPYWDSTADAINDLSTFLFTTNTHDDTDPYLYEAKCQLLFYTSIAIIKLHTIRRRSVNEAKMSSATICLLLLEQSKSYQSPTGQSDFSSCTRSMRYRYLKRIFIIGQWLPTLAKAQFDDIQLNHERYIESMMDHLYPSVSLREKINEFLDHCLSDEDVNSSDFVFVRRFPKFNEKTIDKHGDLMHIGLVHLLNQFNQNNTRKLISCIWTLACMIESDRISLRAMDHCLTREHLSPNPIDFEQKPITIDSLTEQDIIIFLLLCAQQTVHLHDGDSILHPYLLYSSSHLCTPSQKNWWQTATEQISSSEFVKHLATIRLDDERTHEYPPKIILLETAKILFKTAQHFYEEHSNQSASSYEQYAIQYFQTAKANLKKEGMNERNRSEKLFFSYPQKSLSDNKKRIDELIEQCEKLSRQCDELKLLPEPELPKISSPKQEKQDFHISTIQNEEEEEEEQDIFNTDEAYFITAPTSLNRDIDVQPVDSQHSTVIIMPSVEEDIIDTPPPSYPPLVDMLFSHMNGVNNWINRFYTSNEGIQNDINTIRDRLDRLNRATSQMIFSNVKMLQLNPGENNEHINHPPH